MFCIYARLDAHTQQKIIDTMENDRSRIEDWVMLNIRHVLSGAYPYVLLMGVSRPGCFLIPK